jgi:hypothetical protein
MEPRQPSLHRHQQLLVSVATPSPLVVEVAGVPYYVTYQPNRGNPPAAGSFCFGLSPPGRQHHGAATLSRLALYFHYSCHAPRGHHEA